MTNGGRNLNVATETEKSLATALIGLAGAVFAGVLALFATGPLSGLTHTGSRLATIAGLLVFVLLLLSMIWGGREIVLGPGRRGFRDRFNLQACSGAAAILLIMVLGLIVFATMEPSPNDKLKSDVEAALRDITTIKSDLATFKSEFAALKDKEGAFEASVGGKLSDIDKGLQSLSQRIGKLEAAPAKP